ncbi:uncharacterized protein LOC126673443 [Mercurialis annua]|uniref:uncharacterized protein LOC126673443 n=1 Tax=Mercurialis annua TaxID=3986 RepID=UPI0024AE0732|nr:uncharacterized protein LOC126673443 [Mercurialis annua]
MNYQAMLQAMKEKDAAEKKMNSNDFVGAKDHLIKAHKLCPALDNIMSMLTQCDILITKTVELPGCGIIDHYRVLQVKPSSTFCDIKIQYDKLVSLLGVIRRQSPCKKLAMELLENAFKVLTDEKNRSEFDLKRLTQVSPSSSTFKGCFANLEYIHKQKVQMIVQELNLFSANLKSGSSTREEAEDNAGGANLPAKLQPALQNRAVHDFYNFDCDRTVWHFEAGQIWAVNYKGNGHHHYRYARIVSIAKAATCVAWYKPIPVTLSERRWCDAGLPVACGLFQVNSETRMNIEVDWPTIVSYKSSYVHGVTEEQIEIYPTRGEIWAVFKNWELDGWSYDPNSVKRCKLELVEVVSEFSKCLGVDAIYLAKIDGYTSVFGRQTNGGKPVSFHIPPSKIYMFSHQVPAHMFKCRELVEGTFELDQMALPDYLIQDKPAKSNLSEFTVTLQLPPESKCLMPNWSQNDFLPGQVWAVYWGNDFLPRNYVRINNVMSKTRIYVTFLEPDLVLDHATEWSRHDLPRAHGTFKVGGQSANIEMSLFSHLVKCEENTSKSSYKIYPQKGEIWAISRGYNTKQKICQIVKILSEFSEGDWIKVSRLGEVKGCLTFFQVQQHDGFDLVSLVSRADMFRFSHKIPASKVPGIGKYGIPDDSWHLEPLALPVMNYALSDV